MKNKVTVHLTEPEVNRIVAALNYRKFMDLTHSGYGLIALANRIQEAKEVQLCEKA